MLSDRGASRMFAQNNMGIADADRLGRHDLIGDFFLDQAVLVDAGFVRKRVGANDGFIRLHRDAGDLGQQARRFVNFFCLDPGVKSVQIPARRQRHDNFFHRCVAGPLADPVDCAFHLPRAVADCGKRIGDGQAEIIVAVNGNDRIAHVFYIGKQIGNEIPELLGDGIADRVRNIDRDCARIDDCRNHLHKIIPV